MPKPQKAKTSLADLLAQKPERPRNDWSNGRPGGAQGGRRDDDGFPKYDPKAFESDEKDEDEEDEGVPGAGGAFAVLAALNMNPENEDEDDAWIPVTSKQSKKRTTAPAPAPAVAAAPVAPRRPVAPPAPATRPMPSIPAASSFPRTNGPLAVGPGSSAGPSRAPYSVIPAAAAATRSPRPQTHDAEGRPLSDNYYQTFQKVYRNPNGAVCMRFHKTDVVTVQPNGDVVVHSGGYHTRTTFCTILEALEPIGLTLESSLGHEGRGDWSVVSADGTCTPWQDGMVLPATSEADRGRGARLLAAHGVGPGPSTSASQPVAAAVAGPSQRAAIAGPSANPAPSAVPVAAPAPVPAPNPATAWSYRAAAGPAYVPQLRPTAPAAPAAAPVPTPRTAESISELRHVLNAVLAIQDDASGRGQCPAAPAATAAAPAVAMPAAAGAAPDGGAPLTDLDDDHACIACMAALKTTLLIPCGHLVLCADCAAQVLERSGVCPMCRVPVVHHVTLQT